MAQTDNFFNIKGKVGNLIFCNRNGKTYVKSYSGGFVNGNSHDHPNAKASRKRFSEVSHFAANFKKAILPLLWRQADGSFHNQVVSIFSRIKKHSPQNTLFESLQQANVYAFLKQQALNKHHRLHPNTLHYLTDQKQLEIRFDLLRAFKKKYPNALLEVAFCWLEVREDARISVLACEVVMLDIEKEFSDSSVYLDIKDINKAENCLYWPFAVLTLVDPNDALMRSFHPQQSMWAGLL